MFTLGPAWRGASDVFAESFNDGIGAYSLVTGVLTPFSVVAGIDGNSLRGASWSTPASAIQRTIASATRRQISVRFRIVATAPDDGMTFQLLNGGTSNFGLVPIRETAIDASRRCYVSFTGAGIGLTAISTSQLNTGDVYRVSVALAAGAGATVVTLLNETTSATISTTNFTAPPFALDRLRFDVDSGTGTCETQYDDIVLSA